MSVVEVNHPLIEHKIGIMRNKKTETKEFRELTSEISFLLCYEAMRDIQTKSLEIETPLVKTTVKAINEDDYVFVPILRAGMGMYEGIVKIIPNAKFGMIGLCRNEETLKPKRYYYKVPKNMKDKQVILLDPMLATGGSAIDAIQALKEEGVKQMKFLCLIASKAGIKKIEECYPEVQIYCAKIDPCLNEMGYIEPGLGDAGDRIFGTYEKLE